TMRLGGDYLTGTLDRIYRTAEGHWEVADYKTNNIRAAQVAEAGEKYMMQMKSYAMLMAQLF
ncbi:MAG: PD-(D/E)XK nuclease family protein, partial [Calditrichaeota bacterium]|nr:PD-(D/E)XK nuclease family protein [Calditrichota bacterium]